MSAVFRVIAGLFLTGSILALPFSAHAAEEGDEEERIEAQNKARPNPASEVVRDRFMVRAGRTEVFWHTFGYALNNGLAYRFVPGSGVTVSYHLSEFLSVEGQAEYFTGVGPYDLKSLAYRLTVTANDELGVPMPYFNKERFFVGASVGFSPVYGKLNLVSSYVQTFDLGFNVGLGVLSIFKELRTYEGYDENNYPTLSDPLPVIELGPDTWRTGSASLLSPSPTLGVTLRLHLTPWLNVRADLRAHGYLDEVYQNDTLERSTPFRQSLILNTGVSGFLPLNPPRR